MIAKERSKLGVILPAVTGGVAIGLSIICYPFVSPALRRICLPYVPATTTQVRNVLKALTGRKGTVLDIGSGDGRIVDLPDPMIWDLERCLLDLQNCSCIISNICPVIAAAKVGFQSHGVELNPWLVLYSKLKALLTPLPASATFSRVDLWKFSVKPFDNIVIFGVEEMMGELQDKLSKEMAKDARLIVCRFPLPDREPLFTIGSDIDSVWVYNS